MRFFPAVFLFLFLCIGSARAGDEVAIQAGLNDNAGGTYTLPAGTYNIEATIALPENTILQGTPGNNNIPATTFLFKKNLGEHIPIVQGSSGSQVQYISFDGNRDGINYPLWRGSNGKGNPTKNGQGNGDAIICKRVNNFKVLHCNFQHSAGDGLRAEYSQNVEFAYNSAQDCGHDVFYGIRSEGVAVHDNYIQPSCNSAIRLLSVSNARIYSNLIVYVKTADGAGPSIQLQKDDAADMVNVEVLNNEIHDSWGPAFWIVGKTGNNEGIDIHHNAVYSAGGKNLEWATGMCISGFDNLNIHNNVFDSSNRAAILYYAVSSSWATAATSIIDSNIFFDTEGHGIDNRISAQNIQSSNNCYYQNSKGSITGSSLGSSDTENVDPRTTQTPSGWSWNGQRWECPSVQPLPMGNITGIYAGLPDLTPEEEAKFEFNSIFDVFELEYTYTGNIEQGQIKELNSNWESQKYSSASIYLAGYQGQITVNNETYIPKSPDQCAKVFIHTKNLADRPLTQDSTLKLSTTPENKLKAELEVETFYQVKTKKEFTLFGKSINLTDYKTKSKNETYVKEFEAPKVFPVFSEEDLNVSVRYYNNSYNPHAIATVSPKNESDNVLVAVTYDYNKSSATNHRLLGYITSFDNGFKATTFESSQAWISNSKNLTYDYQGCYIKGNFNKDNLKIYVQTPYENLTVSKFNFEEIGDNTDQISKGLLKLLFFFLLIAPMVLHILGSLSTIFKRGYL